MRLCLPPLLLVATYLFMFTLVRGGHRNLFLAIHGMLELIIGGSLVASHVIAIRLFPKRKEVGARLPLVLNGLVVAALYTILLYVHVHVSRGSRPG